MADAQLRLLPAPQPLVERLGVDFFLNAPQAPGVYCMYDALDRLVYVGKAGNLRARLNSYRRTFGQSRKTIRLIHEARRISWEVCATEEEACLRENSLIRDFRPRFNRAGVWPRSARFIEITETASGFSLGVASDPVGESYGAFRAGAGMALAALARVIRMVETQSADPAALPRPLLVENARSIAIEAPPCAEWIEDARAFLAGAGDQLLGGLIERFPEPRSPFAMTFAALQFEILLDFYRRGPARNARLRRLLPEPRRALSPEEHDDLLILGARRGGAEGRLAQPLRIDDDEKAGESGLPGHS